MEEESQDADLAAIAWQLGREPRGVVGIAARCPCGDPCVVTTAPRLDDGTPFPTTYYVTCPRLASAIGSLEGGGRMRDMEHRLALDDGLREQYRAAHERYLTERSALGEVLEIEGISAGGMPERVKCLHVLAGQALACGRGVNPFGDETLDDVGKWWASRPCSDERKQAP
ncbi:MAG TPA: DUF501 domain-containing protein [Acidimicrobiia bacterium]